MDDYSDEDDDDGSAPPDPEPYVFDPSHVADAAAMLDSACTDLQHGYTSERRVIALADARGLGDSPLMWELVHAVGHDLDGVRGHTEPAGDLLRALLPMHFSSGRLRQCR